MAVSWRAEGSSQVGLVRKNNQDRIYMSEASVFAIADGMGGLQDGAKAASLAIGIVADHAAQISDASAVNPPDQVRRMLNDVVKKVDQAILGMTRREGRTAGTTLLIWCLQHDRLDFAWVGDSALFLASSVGIEKLTIDHTVAEEKRRRGIPELVLPQDESTLTRSVGTGGMAYPDFGTIDLNQYLGYRVLGCSDGYSVLAQSQIALAFADDSDDDLVLRRLEIEVIAAGAPDNYSAIIASRIA